MLLHTVSGLISIQYKYTTSNCDSNHLVHLDYSMFELSIAWLFHKNKLLILGESGNNVVSRAAAVAAPPTPHTHTCTHAHTHTHTRVSWVKNLSVRPQSGTLL